jgi:hypothetical protein
MIRDNQPASIAGNGRLHGLSRCRQHADAKKLTVIRDVLASNVPLSEMHSGLQLLYLHGLCHDETAYGTRSRISTFWYQPAFAILLGVVTGERTQERGCLRPATAVDPTLAGIVAGEIGSGMAGCCLNETMELAPLHVCLTFRDKYRIHSNQPWRTKATYSAQVHDL